MLAEGRNARVFDGREQGTGHVRRGGIALVLTAGRLRALNSVVS